MMSQRTAPEEAGGFTAGIFKRIALTSEPAMRSLVYGLAREGDAGALSLALDVLPDSWLLSGDVLSVMVSDAPRHQREIHGETYFRSFWRAAEQGRWRDPRTEALLKRCADRAAEAAGGGAGGAAVYRRALVWSVADGVSGELIQYLLGKGADPLMLATTDHRLAAGQDTVDATAMGLAVITGNTDALRQMTDHLLSRADSEAASATLKARTRGERAASGAGLMRPYNLAELAGAFANGQDCDAVLDAVDRLAGITPPDACRMLAAHLESDAGGRWDDAVVTGLLSRGAMACFADHSNPVPLTVMMNDALTACCARVLALCPEEHKADPHIYRGEASEENLYEGPFLWLALRLAGEQKLQASRLADTVECLVKAGLDIDQADRAGRTALIQAAMSDNLDLARALVLNGADPDRAPGRQKSAAACFKDSGKRESFKALVAGLRAQRALKAALDAPLPLFDLPGSPN